MYIIHSIIYICEDLFVEGGYTKFSSIALVLHGISFQLRDYWISVYMSIYMSQEHSTTVYALIFCHWPQKDAIAF